MDDYIDSLLEEIRGQSDAYNEEPSEEITPKVYPEWQGNTYFIYLDYFFKCNDSFWLPTLLITLENAWA